LLLVPLLSRADNSDLVSGDGVSAKGAKKIKNQYIVMLKDSADADTDSDYLVKVKKGKLIFKVKNAFKGFVAEMSDADAESLKSDPRVQDVVQDQEVEIFGKNDQVTAQAQTLPTGVNRVNAENKTNIGAGDAFFAMSALLVKARCPHVMVPFVSNVFAGLKTKVIGNKFAISKSQLLKALTGILK
jgi:hypothetical protein